MLLLLTIQSCPGGSATASYVVFWRTAGIEDGSKNLCVCEATGPLFLVPFSRHFCGWNLDASDSCHSRRRWTSIQDIHASHDGEKSQVSSACTLSTGLLGDD
ncbi:hypothetical protein BC832DRAFT_19782 [Gaertneriomyces semiglobifer]|nr:hypothetical protein BC832DRAFT_19782 [Gaertneriomyces semiglobifer]